MNGDLNVIVVLKGSERYVWLYSDEQRTECVQSIGRMASNPELSLTCHDAAMAIRKIKQVAK